MDENTFKLIVAIIGLAIQYGVPAVEAAFAALGKDNITLEDIQALKDLCKPPEEY